MNANMNNGCEVGNEQQVKNCRNNKELLLHSYKTNEVKAVLKENKGNYSTDKVQHQNQYYYQQLQANTNYKLSQVNHIQNQVKQQELLQQYQVQQYNYIQKKANKTTTK